MRAFITEKLAERYPLDSGDDGKAHLILWDAAGTGRSQEHVVGFGLRYFPDSRTKTFLLKYRVKGTNHLRTVGNPAGRPVESKNKKTLLREQIEACGPELITRIKAIAFDDDSGSAITALGMLLARLDPPLRPRGPSVEFTLQAELPLPKQFEQVMQAVAKGDLTIDEGKLIVDMLHQLAQVRAIDKSGDHGAAALVDAMRQFAASDIVNKDVPEGQPYTYTSPPEKKHE